jgi:hypothetical protein
LLHLLVFHAHINEMHGSRSKIPEEFNSDVKGLMGHMCNTTETELAEKRLPTVFHYLLEQTIFTAASRLYEFFGSFTVIQSSRCWAPLVL